MLRGASLFTPGDRPDRFDKGWAASNGQLILDLEDAVASAGKKVARDAIAKWLGQSAHQPLLRVNPVDSPEFAEDCALLGGRAVAGVVVPKVNAASDLDPVRDAWPGAALFPLIETPQGLEASVDIGRAEGVRQLLLGALDLHAECGIGFAHPALLAHARLRLVLASRIAGIGAPIDSPHPAVRELDEVIADARAAARLGLAGKLCIHPAQLSCVAEAFQPTDEQLAWAREVVAAAGSDAGALQVGGRMVDAPVVASARAMLARGR